ncbi:NAD(P)/FAD-dependent oxidoreductase [Verminephrobacter eiseniae]|uniref:NAD(P)/FAD-dependent oxidoreductase n=1 Tax=Verminephrobacter eiseniae TaxID=364317 RepID=UPI00223911B2|nr:FAD-dependent oxidoreductase [Verminephrobacter eiseniae]MCW5233947.1 FAD-binding oxidoreductase [Verminephrobacter eiseniae]MCW5294497.1 FAD-binding oxidoreductase [Verminephrobacter eiseniae]MCW8187044.1 FAD-binding oxidoreductase [Verminephrobacter eiseniae]MCW8225423.1 FAD-binding oxidoreductase [Verminephrobacter eiseniae]MCW8236413.1 FAD-binding oxidoreductase [Verminephrobacter eiseniae]
MNDQPDKIRRSHPGYRAGSGWNLMLAPRLAHTTAPSARDFDAIVIGAGFTGLAAARRIAQLQPQASVLVVDATTIGDGASGRNSGFLISLPHNTGMAGHGSPAAVARKQIRLYDMGLQWLHGIVTQQAIECGWSPAGKFHAAATKDGERSLRATLAQYRQWGVGYRELDADALHDAFGTAYYRYGYHSAHSVFVQPAALSRGLADSLPANVHLWEGEPVTGLRGSGPFQVQTASTTLRAGRVIVANNGFATRLGLARDRIFTIYTYAALTPVLAERERAKQGPDSEWGLIPANRLGTTLRKTRDGRLMVRSAYSYQAELPLARVRDMLQDCYRRRYPGMAAHAFEYVWGGATALTRNGALYFGEVRNGLYVSLGCNGAGVLKGTMFGKLLGEMAAGHHSPELTDALGLQRPNWLPPDPIRRIAVVSALKWHKHRAGLER